MDDRAIGILRTLEHDITWAWMQWGHMHAHLQLELQKKLHCEEAWGLHDAYSAAEAQSAPAVPSHNV